MFKFFKKKVAKEIQIDDLLDWLDSFVNEKNISEEIIFINREFRAKREKLKEYLNKLEESNLKDPSLIPERARSIFEGNKESYIKKIRKYLLGLNVPEKYDEVHDFLEKTAEELESLATETQKNFYILNEFVGDQVRPVATKLAEFDKLISSAVERMDRTDLKKVYAVKKLLKEYYDWETQILELRRDIEEINEKKLDLFERKGKLDSKLNEIKSSASFKEYESLKLKLEKLEEETSSLEKYISKLILSLESAIKKYVRDNKDSVLNKYLKNAAKAFVEDVEFILFSELSKLKNSISKLELKKDKEERICKELNALDETKLKDKHEKFSSNKEEILALNKRIKNNSGFLNFREHQGWVKALEDNIADEEFKIEEVENKLERLNPRLLKQKIRDMIKDMDEYVVLK